MTSSRVNELDLLRFLAAMSVVFFHLAFRGAAADNYTVALVPQYSKYAQYGYLGVELFFMISGFVILMSASHGGLRAFVASRISRLFPAFWVCCTATFFVTVFFGAPRFSATYQQYAINMTMLSGFFGIPSIDGVYWSLFVELRFYALIALVLYLNKIEHIEKLLVAWLIATCALEIVPIGRLRFAVIADYSPLFIGGAISYLIWRDGANIRRLLTFAICFALTAYQSIARLDSLESAYKVTFHKPTVLGLIACCFIALLLVGLKKTSILGKRSWQVLGALTYPLYLLHQNIGYIAFNSFPSPTHPIFVFVSTILGLLTISYGVHYFVERKYAKPLHRLVTQVWSQVEMRVVTMSRRGH